MRIKVAVLTKGQHRRNRKYVEVRPGRKFIPGRAAAVLGRLVRVLAVGYEGTPPVLHIEK
mgnify:FL=1